MNILITGGAGFVASHFAYKLKHMDGVFLHMGVCDRQEIQNVYERQKILARLCGEHTWKEEESHPAYSCVKLDVTDQEQVMEVIGKLRPQWILHLAAQSSVAESYRQPERTYEINVGGTKNLLNAVEQIGCDSRILLVGSADQYGIVSPEQMPINEQTPLSARSPYGESKIFQEQLGREAAEKGMAVMMTRSFPHIGSGQSTRFVVADWCRQVMTMKKAEEERGDTVHRLVVGNVDVIRDFTDVRDVVDAYESLLKRGKAGQVYNVASGNGICLRDIPGILANVTGISAITIQHDPSRVRPADIPVLVGDISKLVQTTGWSPRISFEKSCQDILQYFQVKMKGIGD